MPFLGSRLGGEMDFPRSGRLLKGKRDVLVQVASRETLNRSPWCGGRTSLNQSTSVCLCFGPKARRKRNSHTGAWYMVPCGFRPGVGCRFSKERAQDIALRAHDILSPRVRTHGARLLSQDDPTSPFRRGPLRFREKSGNLLGTNLLG